MQYQVLPNVAIGAVYRSESPTEYDLDLLLHATGERDKGKLKLEIPRHVQIGATIDVTPTLRINADVKWTNWANAVGVGSPLVVQIEGDLGTGLDSSGVCVANGTCIKQLIASPNRGDDTYSFHFGAQYKVLPILELQAGYMYDPAVFDKGNLSFLAYSADRHIFSLGGTVALPDAALFGTAGDWEFTVGGQYIKYEDITVQAGQSQTFGLGAGAAGVPTTTFVPNATSFEIGGYIWTAGLSAVYNFGAPEEIALK